MILTRRTMFADLATAIAAPAIIRTPGLLMPIKPERLRIAYMTAGQHPDMTVFLEASDDGSCWSRYTAKSVGDGAYKFHIPNHRFVRAVVSGKKWPQALIGGWLSIT